MKNRWVSLAAGILIQLILGGIYAWSAFIPQLRSSYGLTNGQGGFVFGLSIAVFTVSMTAAGRILSARGPRVTAGMSAGLYTAGFILASVSGGTFPLLILGLGLFTGIGIGFGYVCPLTVGLKWFPRHKGLVTGISVAGFGGGAMLLSAAADLAFKSGIDVLSFFRSWGLLSGSCLFIASLFLSEPADAHKPISKRVTHREVLTAPFGICAMGIFAGTFAGLLINGNLAPLTAAAGFTPDLASRSISLFAVGNASGRIAWGWLFDRLEYRSIPLSLTGFSLGILFLIIQPSELSFPITIGMLGFFFGANFVVYAAAVARTFGEIHFSTLYPLCFLSYGFAGLIGPGIGGYLADLTGSYIIPLFISATILALAGGLTFYKLSVLNRKIGNKHNKV